MALAAAPVLSWSQGGRRVLGDSEGWGPAPWPVFPWSWHGGPPLQVSGDSLILGGDVPGTERTQPGPNIPYSDGELSLKPPPQASPPLAEERSPHRQAELPTSIPHPLLPMVPDGASGGLRGPEPWGECSRRLLPPPCPHLCCYCAILCFSLEQAANGLGMGTGSRVSHPPPEPPAPSLLSCHSPSLPFSLSLN